MVRICLSAWNKFNRTGIIVPFICTSNNGDPLPQVYDKATYSGLGTSSRQELVNSHTIVASLSPWMILRSLIERGLRYVYIVIVGAGYIFSISHLKSAAMYNHC